ncbi:arylesterase [Xinfangfangia sp. D13-10-4-6]|uniref:arylesterase n=1 Tax=Pseudogemmobacter hezensis TaxID=2737662 RepID=UPI0015566FC8|nr:arylesterase [Pseudogemmobacter hezensis]NPD14109.1 arylesterase [Pseudogemmobacter hezensis]
MVQNGYAALRQLRNLTFALVLPVTPVFAADPVVVVALGDSLTAGYGLPDGEGFVPQLQSWLDRQGAGAIIQNAGVSGDTTAGGLSRLDWALGPDADALIVTLGGNDMLRGIPVAEVSRNLDAILQKAKERDLPVLLVGMKAPLNWGPDYKRDFDALYPALAEKYGALTTGNFFAGLLATGADPSDPAALAAWMQGDGIHPNAAGVTLIVEGLGPDVLRLIAASAKDQPQE